MCQNFELEFETHATRFPSLKAWKAVRRGFSNNELWFVLNGAASD